jgi:dipeptidyl aminopeptidase/acylaminoacyl peptidase
MHTLRSALRGLAAALALLAAAGTAAAQQAYRLPPPVVVTMMDAPPPPATFVSPDRAWLLLADRAAMPTIADLSQPMLRLAGTRINPATDGPFRAMSFSGLRLERIADGTVRAIAAPADAKLGAPMWSPDARSVAFTVTGDDGIALWVATVATGEATALTGPMLSATTGAPCSWMPDATELLCRFVPEGRGAPPQASRVPGGPHVQVAEGRASPAPTYEDLLQNPDDERLFEYYFTARLGRVNVATRAVAWMGGPAILDGEDPSPDGRYVLVQTIHAPYSYHVPFRLFPRRIEVWDRDGHVVRQVADLPLGERIPMRGVRAGPRSLEWRANRPATLVWAEALDGGDPRRQVPQRDRVVALTLPAGDTAEIARTELRFGGIQWGAREGFALLSEMDRPSRRMRTWIIDPDHPGTAPRQLFDRSLEDAYADPGRPVQTPAPNGTTVLLQSADGRYLYLSGAGASPQGDHPFLDRLDLRTLRTQRLFQAQDPYYETVLAVLDPAAARILTSRESAEEPANVFVRELARRNGTPRRLTDVRDPTPQLRGLQKQLVSARRDDGVQLSGTLYLPPGYQAGTRLPLILWVYPAEFGSADAASQVRGSPNRFTRIAGASHLFLLTQGYAVLDNPSLPVVGGDTANNGYVRQVVAGARAWIDRMVEMGVADRDRVGVGGHSYGAFTTANLLAHSDLFRTGIARSGAYNRTLTPFGFQNEGRTFWQARDVYMAMSPFVYADSINEPILLIHGEADDNTGTFPIQSERMFAALKGLGARAELVTYPYEAHGYAARETLLDCVARMIDWYDRYVKNPGAPQPAVGR